MIAGGVAANGAIRQALARFCAQSGLRLVAPPPNLCTDNGAMIAWAGIERFRLGLIDDLNAPRGRAGRWTRAASARSTARRNDDAASRKWPTSTARDRRPGSRSRPPRFAGSPSPPRGLKQFSAIGVAGAGAWGIALANVAASAGRRVTLWGRDDGAMRALEESRRSAALPGVALAAGVDVSADLSALRDCEAILVVVPAQATRSAAERLAAVVRADAPLVACAKGIERGSDLFMTEVMAQAAPGNPERDSLRAEFCRRRRCRAADRRHPRFRRQGGRQRSRRR